jgi:hypothetical protein
MAQTGSQPASGPAAGISWRKSSFSGYNGNCVEVADLGRGRMGVRDSKAGVSGPVLQFTRRDWARFLHALKE